MHVGIVADDLTGAMDAAAPFADLGASASVVLNLEGALPSLASVLSIDTDSREASPQEAARTVQRAMMELCADGSRLPFKKIDSTLRGNIGAETIAALAGSGRRCAIIAPAAPAHGRVLRDGQLYVHARRRDENLISMLRSQLPGACIQPLAQGESFALPSDECSVLVADSQDDADLDRIARIGLAHREDVLLVGSSGLAAAVARLQHAGTPPAAARNDRRYRRLWFVVGSYNSRSAEQVRKLLARGDVAKLVVPLTGETPEPAEREVCAEQAIGVIHVEGLAAPGALDPRRIAAQIGELAAMVLGKASAADTALVMTGGDTARATLIRLGVKSIDLCQSLVPGVVHGTALYAGQELGIITKAGGFGDPDLF
ncbi:MAG: hypothetical protein JWP43_3395, partial [Ramlibacter sp.]|nr:hypothetical protein [Ramlibacter sp.]